MIKLTREQWTHVFVHATKTPALWFSGWFAAKENPSLTILALAVVFTSEIVTDLLYWRALNRRPRSGSPEYLSKWKEPQFPDPLNPDDPDFGAENDE